MADTAISGERWKSNVGYNVDAVIADNGTKSDAIDLGNKTLCGIHFPAGVVGTAFTFETAPTSGGTYVAIQDGAGSSYSVTGAASKYVPVDPTKFLGVRFLKLVSGSTETGGPLTIPLATRNL